MWDLKQSNSEAESRIIEARCKENSEILARGYNVSLDRDMN
jgi:hypothetical protein